MALIIKLVNQGMYYADLLSKQNTYDTLGVTNMFNKS